MTPSMKGYNLLTFVFTILLFSNRTPTEYLNKSQILSLMTNLIHVNL